MVSGRVLLLRGQQRVVHGLVGEERPQAVIDADRCQQMAVVPLGDHGDPELLTLAAGFQLDDDLLDGAGGRVQYADRPQRGVTQRKPLTGHLDVFQEVGDPGDQADPGVVDPGLTGPGGQQNVRRQVLNAFVVGHQLPGLPCRSLTRCVADQQLRKPGHVVSSVGGGGRSCGYGGVANESRGGPRSHRYGSSALAGRGQLHRKRWDR